MTDDVAAKNRLAAAEEREPSKERLEREHSELIEELRALIPGAEVPFGFLVRTLHRAVP